MPMYDWHCTLCGEEVAIIRPMKDSLDTPKHSEAECTEGCKKAEDGMHRWEKRIGSTNFVLRGRGWASDGYS